MKMVDRSVRRELDRIAGELLRRQDEVEACLDLFRRRERLRAAAARCPGVRESWAAMRAVWSTS